MGKHEIPDRPLADRIEAWADWVEFADSETAAWAREQALLLRRPDRAWLRKSVLRTAARTHFPYETPAAQARKLSDAWHALSDAEAQPGSLQEMLGRLRHAGFSPLQPRRIGDLIDPALDD